MIIYQNTKEVSPSSYATITGKLYEYAESGEVSMTKWVRGTGSGYRGIYDAFVHLRSVGIELTSLDQLKTVEKILNYVETVVADREMWRRLPEKINGFSTVGVRADLEGILTERKRPLDNND